MISFYSKQPWILLSQVPVSLMFACLGGCTEAGEENSRGQERQADAVIDFSRRLSSLDSTSHYLVAADLNKFRPGRAKVDILSDINWRGYFYMAAEHNGKAVTAIIYELLADDRKVNGGVWIWAIFVDGTFAKFVKPPPSLPSDKEVASHRGTSWYRTKPMKAGDDRFLIRAKDVEAVSIDELKKEVETVTAPPEHIDPGLTIAYLLLRAMGAAPGPEPPASEKDYLRNAALRDQFNAARLSIGMRKSEVEAALKAKPLESGKVDAGEYEIYGSNEFFDINPWLHFSNILIVYRGGKTIAISGVPVGRDWRRKLLESTIDLPR